MSIVKSFDVGNGDMFYIKHNSPNFTVIDCNLLQEFRDTIINEIKRESAGKEIVRFISTSPDLDHIRGLEHFDNLFEFQNFYVVKNDAAKNEENVDFKRYCQLRDSTKAFYVSKGIRRQWLNEESSERQPSGINFYWPVIDNEHFKEALKKAEEGVSPNNISPILTYNVENGATIMWLGDLETPFLEKILDDITLPHADILVAPHHGRKSGRVPKKFLDQIKPKVIIIGQASSEDLHYYTGYNTITQNSAQNITMDVISGKVHFFTSSTSYTVDFLVDEKIKNEPLGTYLGTLNLSTQKS